MFGGYAGAAIAKAGFAAIIVEGWTRTLIFIVIAPLVGMAVGLLLMVASLWVFRRASSPRRVDGFFRKMQLVSAAAFSLMHGANDAQKTMGIIAGALVHRRVPPDGADGKLPIPFWVILLAHTAIGLGTLSGGWRIIKTMGTKITKLQPIGGFAAETGAAVAIYMATMPGRRHQHDAHHHRRDRRRRRDPAPVGGALGRRRADRLGLAPDDSRLGLIGAITYECFSVLLLGRRLTRVG